MSVTAVNVITLKRNNYAVQPGDLAVPMTAMDASNGNSFLSSGREVLVLQNTDSAAHTVTVNSVGDDLGRTDSSLTAYSIPANSIVAIQFKERNGWQQSDGTVTLTTTSALVKMAALQYSF